MDTAILVESPAGMLCTNPPHYDNIDNISDDVDEKCRDQGTLQIMPTAPCENDRCERRALVTHGYFPIPGGANTTAPVFNTRVAPEGWTWYVNPEGSPFYVKCDEHLVTDIPMERLGGLKCWIDLFRARIKALQSPMPKDYEIYLNPEAEGQTCKYYLVNHDNRSLFWIDDVCPGFGNMEMFLASSPEHLGFLLQQQYWKHREYFPHRAISVASRRKLYQILNFARADLMTSRLYSTFPYSVSDCTQFMNILESDQDDSPAFERIYNTYYGADHARISREQQRLDKPAPQRSILMDSYNVLMFNMPGRRNEELELLFNDELAYAMHCQEYGAARLKEWQNNSMTSIGLTVIGVISVLRPTNPISASLGSLAVALALGGVGSSLLLLQRYADADKFDALLAGLHLSDVEHPTLGFQPMAVIHCLPGALATWSVILLATHLLSDFVDLQTMFVQAPTIVFALTFVAMLFKAAKVLRVGFVEPTEGPPILV
ncbi:hypothetical protein PYCCODRAFT_1466796 [Trametes coccinea BRFM310]|uniref:WW domain-containing protein n=1 Tax=Trametes coccinea (strain BRFM310) TaxID=1353009 RepID=A0A1Y2IQP5_TRAC3|nr:hypothetical protein PYCCODRAFT_1466796 [Trametes coccinea BRFM310]